MTPLLHVGGEEEEAVRYGHGHDGEPDQEEHGVGAEREVEIPVGAQPGQTLTSLVVPLASGRVDGEECAGWVRRQGAAQQRLHVPAWL